MRRTVAVGVRIWQGRAQPSRTRLLNGDVPSPRILIKLKAIFFAASSVGITSRFAAPRADASWGRCGHGISFSDIKLRHRVHFSFDFQFRRELFQQAKCRAHFYRRGGVGSAGRRNGRATRSSALCRSGSPPQPREDSDLSQFARRWGPHSRKCRRDKYRSLAMEQHVHWAAKLLAPALSPMMSSM